MVMMEPLQQVVEVPAVEMGGALPQALEVQVVVVKVEALQQLLEVQVVVVKVEAQLPALGVQVVEVTKCQLTTIEVMDLQLLQISLAMSILKILQKVDQKIDLENL